MRKSTKKGSNNHSVRMRVIPGDPTDGSGRVCVHLFVADPVGRFVEPHAVHPVFEDGVQVKQRVQCLPTRGRIACDSRRDVAPRTVGGVTTVTARTDDSRAVTCPACKASVDYINKVAGIGLA